MQRSDVLISKKSSTKIEKITFRVSGRLLGVIKKGYSLQGIKIPTYMRHAPEIMEIFELDKKDRCEKTRGGLVI